MAPPPVSLGRFLTEMLKLSLRRWSAGTFGKMSSLFSRSSKSPPEQRQPTSRKGSVFRWLGGLFAIFFGLSSGLMGRQLAIEIGRACRAQQQASKAQEPGAFQDESLPAQDAPERLHRGPFWPTSPAARETATRSVAWLLTGCVVFSMLLSLGAANRDLSKAQWSMEWLFWLPVPARWIYLAHWLQYALVQPALWVIAWPILSTWCWLAGAGPWGIGQGLLATAYIGLLVGAGRLLVETWLRTRWNPSAIKNFQAAISFLGMLGLVGLMAIFYQPAALRWLVALADRAGGWIAVQPLGIAAQLTASRQAAVAAVPAMCGFAALAGFLSIRLCERITRRGLSGQSGGSIVSSARAPGRPAPAGRPRLSGIVGKELRLLVRDRNFLTQTVIVPIFVFGIQLMVNPKILEALRGEFRHAAALAYSLGAYTLAVTGSRILIGEGQSLWLLYTLPGSMGKLLGRKSLLWGSIAMLYPLAVLGIRAATMSTAGVESILHVILPFVGVAIFTFVATGLGILASDPLKQENTNKIKPSVVYLYLALSALFVSVFYLPDYWGQAQVVLFSAAMAFAIWTKAEQALPYLLDPDSKPRPHISAADAIIAIYAFQAVQLGLLTLLVAIGSPSSPAGLVLIQFIAYCVAAGVVVLVLMLVFRKRGLGVPLTGGREQSARTPRAWAAGILAGCLCAALAGLYVYLLPERVTMQVRLPYEAATQPGTRTWSILFLLVVAAAPLAEEFLFRRLLLDGLLRIWKPGVALTASAAAFALIHPMLSAVPVFVLGLATGLLYMRTRSFGACLLCHAAYNAIVLLVIH